MECESCRFCLVRCFRRNAVIFFFLFLAGFFLSSCAGRLGPAADEAASREDAFARQLLSSTTNTNQGLSTFKGIGRLRLSADKAPFREARIAWTGTADGNLRLEVLSIFGQPIATIAVNSEWFYLHDHAAQFFRKTRVSSSGLKNAVGIPIAPRDVAVLLAGRIPVRPWRHVKLAHDDEAEGDLLLILKTRREKVIQKILIDRGTQEVRRIEMYDESGSLAYRTVFDSMQTVHGYVVPKAFSIESAEGVSARLVVEKYWTNISIFPDAFTLKAPAKGKGGEAYP